MGAGALFALTLPGLVVLLVVLASVEHAWSRLGRRSRLHGRRRHALSAGGMDVFSSALLPGRAVDLEERRVRELRRDDVEDGAPPYGRIDLDSGVAYLDPR
ncbi:DUF6191 domain-containing protein [Blastococcus sp. SYSU D00922]